MKLASSIFAAFLLLTAPTLQAQEHARGRVLITSTDTDTQVDAATHGMGKRNRIGKSNVHVLYVTGDEKQAVEKLKGKAGIASVELDRRVHVSAVPNDPYYGSQWHLQNTRVNTAWDTTQGAGVVIAILDSGVDPTHPDLVGNLVAGYNQFDGNTDTSDVYGHGTAVAGVAAASSNNGVGVAGVAGMAKIMPIRVSGTDGYSYYSTISAGLNWAADHGAKVANVSFGGVAGSPAIQSASNYFKSKGGVVFVSAGNNNVDEGFASTNALVAVAATDEWDNKAYFSSYGTFVNLSAPGTNIQTTSRYSSYGGWNGTSFSSPLAAGVAALMFSANPKLTPDQVQSILYSTAVDLGTAGRDIYFGNGRVDAAAAVDAAKAVVVAPTPVTDTVPPVVTLKYKYRNTWGGGQLMITSTATDASAVTQKMYIDNVLVASGGATLTYNWMVKNVASGVHYIKTVAVDAAGNSTSSVVVYTK